MNHIDDVNDVNFNHRKSEMNLSRNFAQDLTYL